MITSTSNPQVKRLVSLQKKPKVRQEEKCFIVEGVKMVREAPKERLEKIYISETYLKVSVGERWMEKGCPVEVLGDKVFCTVSDTSTPQGILAVVRCNNYSWQKMLHRETPLLLILESLQDPGNFGTIVRSSEGAGVDGIILNRTSVDIYHPKVVRSTMGSIYRVPIAVADDLETVAREMKREDIRVYAAHLKGKHSYYEENYKTGCCFMIGNEANGLTEALTGEATDYIKIPMRGEVESLNAGVAASLLMYEARRQREMEAE